MPVINAPAVIAEITALHDAYERALAAHDVPILNAFFWDSEFAVRYGVGEHLYGAAAIRSYRQASAPAFTQRVLERREILTFGTGTASVMCELTLTVAGRPRHGRQSQLWIRFPTVGWKIVTAHVSNAASPADPAMAWDAYFDQATVAVQLSIDPEHRPTVVRTLQRTAAIAAPLLAFSIPEEIEIAPVFTA